MVRCKDCGDTGAENFTNTSRKQRLCRLHMNARKRKHRAADIARVIMGRIHGHKHRFTLRDTRAVLAAFRHRSILSGKSDDITIVRIDREKPLTVDNAMVIDVREPRNVANGVRGAGSAGGERH